MRIYPVYMTPTKQWWDSRFVVPTVLASIRVARTGEYIDDQLFAHHLGTNVIWLLAGEVPDGWVEERLSGLEQEQRVTRTNMERQCVRLIPLLPE